MPRRSLGGAAALLVAVLVAFAGWWLQQDEPAPAPAQTEAPAAESYEAPSAEPVSCTAPAGLDCIAESELPAEAIETLASIDAGGPFAYERDGVTFHNYEGILPEEYDGYYREFTVETPGLDHRGARRIVTGSEGEYYWSRDHYESFEVIVR